MALALCGISRTNAADVTIFGVPAKHLMSSAGIKMTITSKPDEITMLNISNTGAGYQAGRFSNTPDARNCVKSMFEENPPRIVAGSFTSTSASIRLGGSIVGKNEITLSAQSFSFQPLTVFGTNGQFRINFRHPLSLIKSLTMTPSDLTVTHGEEKLRIGSVWGDFTGEASSDEQIIHLIGYTSIELEINSAAIAELLSKK